MNIEVIRKHFKPSYTIGKLFINGEYFCDTLEDTDRGLTDTMTEEDILKVKVKGNTCIPYGKYEITLNIKSPKYSNFIKYKYAAFAEGKIPRLLNVKGFEGILIHAGNTADHTDGCILVGENKVKGQVINSQATWTNLYKLMKAANDKKEPITITIQ